jgi:hypothetical protein
MTQRMLPETAGEDIKGAFGKFHSMDTAELIKTMLGLFQGISRASKEDLVSTWGLLDFFENEVPVEDQHRIRAIRRAILHRLEEVNYSMFIKLTSEKKHF